MQKNVFSISILQNKALLAEGYFLQFDMKLPVLHDIEISHGFKQVLNIALGDANSILLSFLVVSEYASNPGSL